MDGERAVKAITLDSIPYISRNVQPIIYHFLVFSQKGSRFASHLVYFMETVEIESTTNSLQENFASPWNMRPQFENRIMLKTIAKDCEFCNESFQALVKEVKRGNARFCSISCSSSRKMIKAPNLICAYCSKEFYRSESKHRLSKSGLFFCCREHKDLAQRIGGIEAIQPSHYNGGNRSDYRTRALNNLPHRCNRCDFDKVLHVHHKDRDRSNNDIENLEILCPNCHALEHRSK